MDQVAGRTSVLIVAVGLVSITVLSLLLSPGVAAALRTVLAIGLAWALVGGYGWARWALILVSAGEISVALGIMATSDASPPGYALVLWPAVAYLFFIGLVVVPHWGGQYFGPPGEAQLPALNMKPEYFANLDSDSRNLLARLND